MGAAEVFIIILGVATAGHFVAPAPPSSELHHGYTDAVQIEEIKTCLSELKASFDYESRPIEELEEDLESCYDD